MNTDYEMRVEALKQAVLLSPSVGAPGPEHVVRMAEAFYEFLRREPSDHGNIKIKMPSAMDLLNKRGNDLVHDDYAAHASKGYAA